MRMPHPCVSGSKELRTFLKLNFFFHNEKMTSFKNILGQSWTVKFHKVKLLKFKTFKLTKNISETFWNIFHYEEIIRSKNVLSFLELEGQGRGIIMWVTRLLLLGLFNYIAINAQPKQIYWQCICLLRSRYYFYCSRW